MRIFIDGYGAAAEGIVTKLVRNHHVRTENLLVNTYDLPENQSFLSLLKNLGVKFFCENYADNDFLLKIQELEPSYIISIYGRRIIPNSYLSLCTGGAFNLHPSLLPYYKGCFSSVWAILNGESITGITIHNMVAHVDAGDILFQKEIPIAENETAYSLYHKLIGEFVAEFDQFFKDLQAGKIQSKVMPKEGSYYPRKIPFNGVIDQSWDDVMVDRFIRAMHFPPHLGAVLNFNGVQFECSSFKDYKRIL
jgi:methionyl-tRNA formyltransferase